LARIIYQRNRIDPTKISGPYSLLAVMLLVAEILFALWFYKAESSTERSIAGLIMAGVFVCLMVVVLKMNRASDRANANCPRVLF
jgi:tryptophan-rich sensory protein